MQQHLYSLRSLRQVLPRIGHCRSVTIQLSSTLTVITVIIIKLLNESSGTLGLPFWTAHIFYRTALPRQDRELTYLLYSVELMSWAHQFGLGGDFNFAFVWTNKWMLIWVQCNQRLRYNEYWSGNFWLWRVIFHSRLFLTCRRTLLDFFPPEVKCSLSCLYLCSIVVSG